MTVHCKKRITIADALKHPFLTSAHIVRSPLKAQGFVSLRRVDECFGHLGDEIDAEAALESRKAASFTTLSFEIGLKQLKSSIDTQFRSHYPVRKAPEKTEPKKRRRGLAAFFKWKDFHKDKSQRVKSVIGHPKRHVTYQARRESMYQPSLQPPTRRIETVELKLSLS
jgi:hypothetical protein